MSGPKGYSYSVVSAEELRRREDEARSARCRLHTITLAGLAAQLRHFGASVHESVNEPSPATHESLIAWESTLQRVVKGAEDQVREESAEAIMRRLNATMQAVDVSSVSLGVRSTSVGSSTSAASSGDLARVAAEVAKVVELIARLLDPPTREELTQIAQRLLQTTNPAQARGDLLSLKTRTASALQIQDYRSLASVYALDLAHITTPEADAVRSRAASVTSAQDVAEIREAVADATRAASRAVDADFVEAALVAALSELGFDIGDGFELADLGRSVAIADHADHPRYGLRVQLNAENGMIYTRVVADGSTSPDDDIRAEEETCVKVHALAEQMQLHGVAAELKSERAPGETPVERIHEATAHKARKRRRPRAVQQKKSAR